MAIDEKFDINALAIEYGQYCKIERLEDEPTDVYRSRVAGKLRKRGNIIEAHEASSGRRYNDPTQGPVGPMAGIFGAVAQAMQGREYSPNDPERQVGDDIAAGVVAREGRDKADSALGAIFGLLGPETGMDLLDSMYKDKR